MNTKFQGVIPPVSSILKDSNNVDKDGMENLINFLIDSGVHGLFFLGTGGEFSQMTTELRKEIAEFAVETVNGRAPVLIGTGTCSTDESILLSNHAKDIGADGVIIVNPYYWKLTEENLYKHYEQIAQNVDLPIILYNYPNFSGQDLTPEFVARLAINFPNIVGIKETVDSAGHIREMILKVKGIRPDFSVFSGYDDHLFNTLSLGGDGAIPASSNFVPELPVGIYEAFQSGDYQKAIDHHRELAVLPFLYKLDSPFVNVIKESTRIRGIKINTYCLPPTRPISEEGKLELKETLEKVFHFIEA